MTKGLKTQNLSSSSLTNTGEARRVSVSAEWFNGITHLVGLLMMLAISWILIRFGYAKNWENAMGVTFFTVGMLLMYVASMTYHFWKPGTKGKLILRKLDHISIYILIASSYTPICLQLVEDNMFVEGWVSFGVIWLMAILGIIYKIFWWLRYPRFSIILYLILGWSILFFIEPVRKSLTSLSLILIIAEGVIYTLGIYFFVNDKTHRYYHGIWHIFVILGTLCHWAAVFVMAWPWENGLWAN